ncbi:MAG TPA: hypothetical protein VFY73_01120 [Ideonella sp.]|uniref:hypothetical protein n=1 Tax=Ideonella sp. TaxID=1929293 RepID=UPI002E36A0D5|nr:hypothetical protein [Ideonella sp.]HEX5682607.1 hypothetical protein [Ideonella sp.]
MQSPRPLVSLALAVVTTLAQAQAVAPVAASGASAPAPAPTKPVRRALTPEELRNTATFPDELRPDGPIKPQVVVPLGRKPPPPTGAAASAAAQAGTTPAGKINDEVARCKARSSPQMQAACGHEAAASAAPGR